MKRFLLITLTILLLVAAMAVPAFATTDGHVAVSDAGAKAGDLAYVTVALSGLENASSIAVQMESELALDADASEWLLEGDINWIDSEENTAAFTWNQVRSVNDKVLKLAYQIPADAERDTAYSVELTVEVRNLENQLCMETVSAKITVECTHDWEDATCTVARTCKICGATQGKAKGHKWNPATCTEVKTCTACGETQGDALGHKWKNATCTAAKTCSTCGATEGAALGHSWKNATCTVAKTCSTCGVTEGNALGHSWKNATCTAAKTCSTCGVTEGNALGHKWKNATCTAAKTCSTCGATEGAALGHSWKNATCTAAKTCSTCGATEGAALGHSWKNATCTAAKTCSTCGATEGKALGHSEVTVAGKAANCTDKGLTDGKKCSVCGTVTVAQKEIGAKGHSFKDGRCTVCNAADPNYVPPTQPTEPAPSEPKPTEPKPTEPAPTEPKPTEPAPTEPKPTEPKPTEPKPTEPSKPEIPTVEGVNRVAGDNRYSTGLQVADQLKTYLGVTKFNAIVVASGREFPDALAGSYLANQKGAPILLVNSKDAKSFDNAKNYIAANLATGGTVYILGGEAAVPKQMETVLKGYNVKRLAGSNRYGTNLEILKEAGTAGQEILICTGRGFADSLSASAVNKPILLLNNKTITADQKAFLQNSSKKFIIIGGESAISAAMKAELEKIGTVVTRIAGSNRYETSVEVANYFFKKPTTAVVAYAKKFPDGLCGGPLANALNAPLILTAAKVETQASSYMKANGIKDGMVLGGTSALPQDTVNKVFG